MIEHDNERLRETTLDSIPKAAPEIVEWAHEHVVFPSSARSTKFNVNVTPWLREPLVAAVDPKVRIIDLQKPVQSGGSAFGEVLMLYWMMFGRGFFQYNWSNDDRFRDRWESRVKPILEACSPVWRRIAAAGYQRGQFDLGNVYFKMQGAFVDSNLDSDTVSLQINEEVHDWKPGHLQKARNRSTAVWNYKSVDISNAGTKGDQFDQSVRNGTMQPWMILCPGCGKHHVVRTRWDDAHPELGGLRYDADGARLGNFEYDYNKIRPTIEIWAPCGHRIHNEDLSARRAMSIGGRYADPTNVGAELSHRSYFYEQVSVDYIDLMTLVKAKHDALRARALGDPEPWKRYKQEKECIPFDPNDVPIQGYVSVSKGIRKDRAGLSDPKLRLFALDRQQGSRAKGEIPHWWLVIRDFKVEDGRLKSRLVFEGKVEEDEDVIKILDDHKCARWQGCADSGDDTTHVYLFCLKYGINAIKGGKEEWYAHVGGARRIFSQERPLHVMLNRPSNYPYVQMNDEMIPDPREPMFWLYSKKQIRERLHWLRTETEYETPEDVSDDYKSHNEAEERVEKILPSDGSRYVDWVQMKDRNDLFVDEAYIAMQVDMAGMIISEMAEKQK